MRPSPSVPRVLWRVACLAWHLACLGNVVSDAADAEAAATASAGEERQPADSGEQILPEDKEDTDAPPGGLSTSHHSSVSEGEVGKANLSQEEEAERQFNASELEAARGYHVLQIKPGANVPPSVLGSAGQRHYVLYVPKSYHSAAPIPLWIHAPGTDVRSLTVFEHNVQMAETHSVAMVVLSGLHQRMSVARFAQAQFGWHPDDVAYTRVVLREVMDRISVDMQRIRCVGFSRGARFCSRLASELSTFISAIAAVSGIRYPEPNNSTRPMPVIAFHGLKDKINPFWGVGPAYWGESVPLSLLKWARFNGCKNRVTEQRPHSVQVVKYTECTDNADVMLIRLDTGEHEWPNSSIINARVLILEFFTKHQNPERCHTATADDQQFRHCYEHVIWAKTKGIVQQPALYKGLSNESSFEDFQTLLHNQVYADCLLPCPPAAAEAKGAGETKGAGEAKGVAETLRAAVVAKADNEENYSEASTVVKAGGASALSRVLRASLGGVALAVSAALACSVATGLLTAQRLHARCSRSNWDLLSGGTAVETPGPQEEGGGGEPQDARETSEEDPMLKPTK